MSAVARSARGSVWSVLPRARTSRASAGLLRRERTAISRRRCHASCATGGMTDQTKPRAPLLPHHKLVAYGVAVELLLAVKAANIRDAKLRDEALRAAKGACLNCAEGAGRYPAPTRRASSPSLAARPSRLSPPSRLRLMSATLPTRRGTVRRPRPSCRRSPHRLHPLNLGRCPRPFRVAGRVAVGVAVGVGVAVAVAVAVRLCDTRSLVARASLLSRAHAPFCPGRALIAMRISATRPRRAEIARQPARPEAHAANEVWASTSP